MTLPVSTAPALEDEFTARRFAVSVRQVRVMTLYWAILLVWVVAACLGFVVSGLADVVLPAGRFALPVFVVLFLRLGTRVESSALDWRPMPRQLLAEQPWRETPALVLNLRGTVLALPGGEYIRVAGLPQAVREVVVRAGRVWVVGPDAAGRLAVRVDGMYVPWPARRVPPPRATAALPTGQTIAAMWMDFHLAPMRAGVVLAGFGALFGVVAAIPPWRWWDVLFGVFYVIVGAIGVSWFRYVGRLRHSGPWVRADAEVQSWHARWNGLADGTVALRFADGSLFTARLDKAPVDLFANVAHDKVLWVSDNGVVGYPYYPVLAAARLTPLS